MASVRVCVGTLNPVTPWRTRLILLAALVRCARSASKLKRHLSAVVVV